MLSIKKIKDLTKREVDETGNETVEEFLKRKKLTSPKRYPVGYADNSILTVPFQKKRGNLML